MTLDLGAGITVRVTQPVAPTIQVDRPQPSAAVVVPLAGPQGPPGPGGGAAGAYEHTQSSPALLVQVQHNLAFKPAGIVCVETDGTVLEYAGITYPASGITEITFGVPFVGTIYVS